MAKRLVKKANAVKSSRKKPPSKLQKSKAAKKPSVAKKSNVKAKAKMKPVKKKTLTPQKISQSKKRKSTTKAKPIKKPVKVLKPVSKKTPKITMKPKKTMKVTSSKVKATAKTRKKLSSVPSQKIIEGEYMGSSQQKQFREILLNWKKQLLGEMERTVHHMQDDAANFPDPNDRATQEEEFSLELRARDRERKLIKKIDEALARLDNHDYGYCEACGIEIGAQRLNARPTATLCIDCKTIDEIREKHFN